LFFLSSSKEVLNDTQVHNLSQLLDLVKNRPRGKPLITVSNHDSCIDDPLLFGAILPTKYFFDFDKKYFRWSLGAKEVCFSKPSHSLFMRAGQVLFECMIYFIIFLLNFFLLQTKVLPIIRGYILI